MDDAVEYIKRNKELFKKKRVTKSSYNEYHKVYGKLLAKGSTVIKQKYTRELRKIIKEADSNSVQKLFKDDLIKKKPKNPKLYLQRRKQSYINFKKGSALEDVFIKQNGGIKPNNSIGTQHTNRFVDNIKKELHES